MRPRLLPLLLLPLLAACGGAPGAGAQDRPVTAVAALWPLEHVLERVGGDRVSVEGLVPPGAEPHDLELGARQTARVVDADLLLHLSGFQPAVDEAAAPLGDRALDVLSVVEPPAGHEGESAQEHAEHADAEHAGTDDGHEHTGEDPHVWLDPLAYAGVADAVAARLAELDPEGADGYAARAVALRADLEQLDEEYRTGLADCERRELVVSHEAFGHLTARYDLEQVGIAGLDPEAEPSPARLAAAARFAREHGVTTIFFETLVSPDVAETVAQEVGATTAVLDPLEGEPEGGDYLTAARANLAALRDGLGCR